MLLDVIHLSKDDRTTLISGIILEPSSLAAGLNAMQIPLFAVELTLLVAILVS